MYSKGDIQQICQRALDKYGRIPQLLMMQEECAEVIQAVSHLIRERTDEEPLLLELADVALLLEQMKLMFGEDRIDEYFQAAAARLEKRLDENDETLNKKFP